MSVLFKQVKATPSFREVYQDQSISDLVRPYLEQRIQEVYAEYERQLLLFKHSIITGDIARTRLQKMEGLFAKLRRQHEFHFGDLAAFDAKIEKHYQWRKEDMSEWNIQHVQYTMTLLSLEKGRVPTI